MSEAKSRSPEKLENHKELVAVADGYRESQASWTAFLQDLNRRGLALVPKLAVGDGVESRRGSEHR